MATETMRKHRSTGLLGKGQKRVLGRILLYVIVILLAVWSLFPFVYMLQISVSRTVDVVSAPPKWTWPPRLEMWSLVVMGQEFTYGSRHYKKVGGSEIELPARRVPHGMLRSMIVCTGTTLLNLIIGSFAGYSMARYSRFWFTEATLNLLMITRMLPGLALVIPFFILFRVTGLMNTLYGLIIAYTSFILPLTVWIMRGYFSSVPKSLEWSAQVDGCNWFQAFRRIFLPVAMPGLVAAGIFTFLVAWNEFLFALLLASHEDSQTVIIALIGLWTQLQHRIDDYPALYVSGIIALLPPVLIAFVFQRYLVQGMLSGSMKG
jgi:multiple sugar transport system permease protein